MKRIITLLSLCVVFNVVYSQKTSYHIKGKGYEGYVFMLNIKQVHCCFSKTIDLLLL